MNSEENISKITSWYVAVHEGMRWYPTRVSYFGYFHPEAEVRKVTGGENQVAVTGRSPSNYKNTKCVEYTSQNNEGGLQDEQKN